MRIRRWFVPILVFVGLIFSGLQAKAQSPTLVNKPGVVKKASKQKDEKGKNFRLRKRQKVTVVYERGTWYWVKNKKGQQAWVLKKNIRLKKGKSMKAKAIAKAKAKAAEKAKAKAEAKAEAKAAQQAKADAEAKAAAQAKADAHTTALAIAHKPKDTPAVKDPVPLHKTQPVQLSQHLPQFKKAGQLNVITSETDVRIRVDGKDVGKAPLKGLSVKGGLHTVSAEKDGFIASSCQVDVDGSSISAALAMQPTQEKMDAYNGQAGLWNTMAYAGLGLGAVTTLAGIGVSAWGQMQGSAARAAIYEFNNQEIRPQDESDELSAQRDSAATMLLIGEITLLSGIGIGGFGAVAALLAPDGDRYQAYQGQE